MLGISPAEQPTSQAAGGQWWYPYEFKDDPTFPSYCVNARHGHLCDIWNYNGKRRGCNGYCREDYLQAPMGDVLTTEFAVKIPWKVNKLLCSADPRVRRDAVENLEAIDNVRPLSQVVSWIYHRIRSTEHPEVREALDKAVHEIGAELLDIELVRHWKNDGTIWASIFRLLSNPWVSWLPKRIIEMLDAEKLLKAAMSMTGDSNDPSRDLNVQTAFKDCCAMGDARVVLNGHTHNPLQQPLRVQQEKEIIYINTGTWRPRNFRTFMPEDGAAGEEMKPKKEASDFVELKQMTYAILYRSDENTRDKKPGTYSFDVWTGAKKKIYQV
jgi:UDP-2,3-diacylglucosamine pyrophosphatase LpxH